MEWESTKRFRKLPNAGVVQGRYFGVAIKVEFQRKDGLVPRPIRVALSVCDCHFERIFSMRQPRRKRKAPPPVLQTLYRVQAREASGCSAAYGLAGDLVRTPRTRGSDSCPGVV